MIASSFHVLDCDLKQLCLKFYKNGFPKDFVEECISRVLNRFYEPKEPVDQVSVLRKEVLMVKCHHYLCNISVLLKHDILKLVSKFPCI